MNNINNEKLIKNMLLSGNRRDVLTMVINEAVECCDLQIKLIDLQAKELHKKFEALNESGFTPDQSIELIKGKAI